MRRLLQNLRLEGGLDRGRMIALVAFILGLAMALIAVGTIIKVRYEISRNWADLRSTRDISDAASNILSDVVNSETGYRGFLLSGQARYLKPYHDSVRELPGHLSHLSVLSAEEPAFKPIVRGIEDAVSTTMILIDRAIADARSGGAAAGVPNANVQAIDDSVSDLRRRILEFQKLLGVRIAERRDTMESVILSLLMVAVLLIVGVALAGSTQVRELFAQARRYMSESRRSSEEIRGLANDLSRSRSELGELNRRLSVALAAARVKVFAISKTGTLEWVSHLSIGLLHGRDLPVPLAELADPRDRQRVAAAIANCFETEQPCDFEMRAPREDDDVRWFRIHIAPDQRTGTGTCLAAAVDITAIKEREEGNFWLMRELSHRSKNLLAIVQAMARQTSRTTADRNEFLRRFSARLRGLAASHDLLVKAAYSGASLIELITSQLDALEGLVGSRILFSGPDVRLRPEAAQNLGMAFHELATNAHVHGALSTAEGRVAINWRITGQGAGARLIIEWTESGGPPPKDERVEGFGTILITRNLPRALNGRVALSHMDDGTRCHIDLPLETTRETADQRLENVLATAQSL